MTKASGLNGGLAGSPFDDVNLDASALSRKRQSTSLGPGAAKSTPSRTSCGRTRHGFPLLGGLPMRISNGGDINIIDSDTEDLVNVHPDFDYWDGDLAILLGRPAEDFDTWRDPDEDAGSERF